MKLNVSYKGFVSVMLETKMFILLMEYMTNHLYDYMVAPGLEKH